MYQLQDNSWDEPNPIPYVMSEDEQSWKQLTTQLVAVELMSREIAELTEFSQLEVMTSYIRAAAAVVKGFSRADCEIKCDLVYAMMRPGLEYRDQ